MLLDIFKAFLSGCCWPVFAPFFWGFNALKPTYNNDNMIKLVGKNDPYYLYTLLAPLYFGTMSVIALLVSTYFKLNIRLSYLIITLISTMNISLLIKLNNVYNFSSERWIKQYLYLLLFHGYAYNLIIVNIYLLIK
jgi:hypothetical protein